MIIQHFKKDIILKSGNITCIFEKDTGRLMSVDAKGNKLPVRAIDIDVGIDGAYAGGLLKFDPLDEKRTWELPLVMPTGHSESSFAFEGFYECFEGLCAAYVKDALMLKIFYRLLHDTLSVTVDVTNRSGKPAVINGVAFITAMTHRVNEEEFAFDFPGNIPHGVYSASGLDAWKPVEAGLVNSATHVCVSGRHCNILFADGEEKWSTGVYRDSTGLVSIVNIAAVEGILGCSESFTCGSLYIQPADNENPYAAIREFHASMGLMPALDGIRDGVMYSCHPFGTMDSGFSDRKTLDEYAKELNMLKDMGIDHVWLLPVFDHGDRGVYHPTDQSIIDRRYGGDEAVRTFCRKAHELGMTVLFDYVPHGPAPHDPLALEKKEWCSMRRDGSLQTEWDCVSFDMANPEYGEYTVELVKDHIERFDIDGTRIDCAMGGLSNWKPCRGNRPSSSNLKGGVAVTEAFRRAFTEKGKKPLILPENFNPVPFYFPYTDAFYDMPLYRVFVELEALELEPSEYADRLTRWLEAELLSTPKGYNKLRFLGNHDTVTWVFQKARAVKAYGLKKAEALWALISFIDGMPMLYQGDEDPAIYHSDGPVLRDFFKKLFDARKRWLGHDYDMTYIRTGTPVVAFRRNRGSVSRLVLINLSPVEQRFSTDGSTAAESLLGGSSRGGDEIVLEGYCFDILDSVH